MSFREIIGQDRAINILQNALAKSRLAHAYLFEGPSGVGKAFTALTFAKALNCANRPEGGSDCCNECISCKKIDAGNHPDISRIELLKDKSGISIDQIRQLQSQISLKPYEAKYKVFYIVDADLMGQDAQGALLKTLEEPPVKSLIILTTSNSAGLFVTIVSRCQPVKFPPLGIKQAGEIFCRRYNMGQNDGYFLAYIAQYGLLDFAVRPKAGILELKNRIIDELERLLANPAADESLLKESFLKEPQEEILWTLSVILWWFRDMLIFKETQSSIMLANKDRLSDLEALAARYDAGRLGAIIDMILKTIQLIRQTNVNPKLAVTVLGMDLIKEAGYVQCGASQAKRSG